MRARALTAMSLALALGIATSAHAFVLNSNPLTRRPDGEYTINTSITHSTLGANSPSGPSWNTGFIEALDAWNDAAGLGALVDLSANGGVFEDPCGPDNGVHGVGFTPDVCGVQFGGATLAVAIRSFRLGGLVTDGNIVFRDDEPPVPWDIVAGNQGAFDDFRRVAVHEIGHLLGLDHPPGNAAIMFATVQDGVEVPQADDIAGIQALYDLGCPIVTPVGSGPIAGSLDATDCLDTEINLSQPASNACTPGPGFESDSFVDLYRVSLPSGTNLEVSLSSSEFNPTIQVFDTGLSTELGCDWSNNLSPATLNLALAPGDYVVATRSVFSGSGQDYDLVLTPEPTSSSALLGLLGGLWALRRRGSR